MTRIEKKVYIDFTVDRMLKELCVKRKITYSDLANSVFRNFLRRFNNSMHDELKALQKEDKRKRHQLFFIKNYFTRQYRLAQAEMHTTGQVNWKVIKYDFGLALREYSLYEPEIKKMISPTVKLVKKLIQEKEEKKLFPLLHRIIFEDISGVEEYDPRGGR